MTTVHVAFVGDYDDRRVVGCYSTRDLAVDAVIARDRTETRESAVVEEYVLDAPPVAP